MNLYEPNNEYYKAANALMDDMVLGVMCRVDLSNTFRYTLSGVEFTFEPNSDEYAMILETAHWELRMDMPFDIMAVDGNSDKFEQDMLMVKMVLG